MLPARLARLARGFAIIFVREFFLAAAAAPATAIAATVSATPAASAARSTRSTGFGLGTGFIDLQSATADIFAIERGDGFGGFFIVLHFDETEAPGAAGFAVGSDVDASRAGRKAQTERADRRRWSESSYCLQTSSSYWFSPERPSVVSRKRHAATRPNSQCPWRLKIESDLLGRQTRSGRQSGAKELEERKADYNTDAGGCRDHS